MQNSPIARFKSLRELTKGVLAKSMIARLEKMFSVGETVVVSIHRDGNLIGDLTLT